MLVPILELSSLSCEKFFYNFPKNFFSFYNTVKMEKLYSINPYKRFYGTDYNVVTVNSKNQNVFDLNMQFVYNHVSRLKHE